MTDEYVKLFKGLERIAGLILIQENLVNDNFANLTNCIVNILSQISA